MSTRVWQRQAEELTVRLGNEMFDRMERSRPWITQFEWWQEWGLRQFMKNERLKVQAFRFIDVLPAIGRVQPEIARHMQEYFVLPQRRRDGQARGSAWQQCQAALAELESGDPQEQLERFVSRLMNFRRLDGPRARLLSWSAWKSALAMAGRFIAGATPQEAERAILRMRRQQLAFTIDVLGEAALSRKEAESYQQTYLDLLTELPRHAATWPRVPLADEADGQPLPRVNVSVKLTSIHPGLDAIAPERSKQIAKERLRPLLRKSMEQGVHLHIDMEHYAIKDLTLELCRELFMEPEFRDYPYFGIVLQAYLKDGDRDAEQTVAWARQRGTPVWVRLVKGAYWDSETVWADQAGWPWPVWEQKWQSDACFERMTRVLLENWRHTPCAFASHNIRSLACAMAWRQLLEVPASAFELQMLYGMGDPIKRAGVEMGQRCRIYTPYGQLLPGMAYFIRRLLENTSNESFLRQAGEDTPREELLRNPVEVGAATPAHVRRPIARFERGELIMDPFENVANTDFSRAAQRQRMEAALAGVRAGLGRDCPLVVDGRRLASGRWREARNPSRPAELIGRVAQAGADEVERAVAAAARAFGTWRRVPVQERAAHLFRLAGLLEQQRFDVAALATLECGKPWREADADVSEAIDYCNYYGKEMIRIADHPRRRDIPGETNEYLYAPRGVVAVISPWNFPLALLAGTTAAALVTGNTVVMKPASAAAVTGFKFMELLEAAGIPPGVVNYLPGPGPEAGELLVKHRQVALVAFTGSRDVGRRVYQLAAAHPTSRPGLKCVLAEMGAKNAIIVDSDADLDEAIKGVVASAFGYAGQKCTAASRCIVLAATYERFVERLVEAAGGLKIGPADDPTTSVPPVIDRQAFDAIRQWIAVGKREATCALEVDASALVAETGGYYIGPVIFTDVPPEARIAREEIFGPVLAVLRARDFDQALEMFNSSDYALTGGIYSRSPANIERARSECECGNLYINRRITGSRVDLQPFGGLKLSGQGARAGGPDYLVQFCEPRTITENTLRRGFAPRAEVVETLG